MGKYDLIDAVNEGNYEKCRLLVIKSHKLLFITNDKGQDALDIAIEKGYKDIEDLIRSNLMYTMSDE